jgi:hypothetical protein
VFSSLFCTFERGSEFKACVVDARESLCLVVSEFQYCYLAAVNGITFLMGNRIRFEVKPYIYIY